jgi:hypothetical protein
MKICQNLTISAMIIVSPLAFGDPEPKLQLPAGSFVPESKNRRVSPHIDPSSGMTRPFLTTVPGSPVDRAARPQRDQNTGKRVDQTR